MNKDFLKSDKFFEFLAENASDLIYIYRLIPEPKFEYVSPSSTRITGYTPEEHYADPELGLKLIHPDDMPILKSFLDKKVNTEPVILRWKKKDGSIIWTEQVNTPIFDDKGNVIAIQGIARDITNRKLVEEKLIESEKVYKHLFEHNPLPMWIYDLETLKILAVNNAAIKKYGYSKKEFLSLTIKDIRPEEEIPALMKNISESKDDLQKSKPWKHKLKDGTIIFTEISSHSLNYEGHNARLVLANDITEQIISEEKIKNLTRVYAVLSEINQAIVRIHDKQKLFNEICRIIVEIGKFKFAWIGVLDENTLDVKPVASFGSAENYLRGIHINLGNVNLTDGLTANAFKTGKHIIINDLLNDALIEKWKLLAEKFDIRSAASFPIKVSDKIVAVLSIYSDIKDVFDIDEIKLLDELSNDISFTLEFLETESEKEKIRAELEYQVNLLSNVNDAIIATDKNLRITYWNEAAEQIYGIKKVRLSESQQGMFYILSIWNLAEMKY